VTGTAEAEAGRLGDEHADHRFPARRITNLRADRHVLGHGDVRNRAVAKALLHAALPVP
jgi:hypothetical protein